MLAGETISTDEALAVLECPDDELLDLLAAVYRVRRRWFGNQVQLYFLMNAKSGLCPEDCGYCSQSKVSEAEIPRYNLLEPRQAARRRPPRRRAEGPHVLHRDLRPRAERARDAGRHDDRAGNQAALQPQDLRLPRPADAGAGPRTQGLRRRPREPQPQHERKLLRRNLHDAHLRATALDTLHAVRDAGMEMCSGGIIGMGERRQDVVDMAIALRDLGVQSIPVNFLNPDRRHAARPAAATSTRATA